MGRDGASFTTTPRAAMTIRRRTADSAGRSTRSTALWRDGGIRESVALTVKPQQDEKLRNDAPEGLAVAPDGLLPVDLPVHVVPILTKNKTGTHLA